MTYNVLMGTLNPTHSPNWRLSDVWHMLHTSGLSREYRGLGRLKLALKLDAVQLFASRCGTAGSGVVLLNNEIHRINILGYVMSLYNPDVWLELTVTVVQLILIQECMCAVLKIHLSTVRNGHWVAWCLISSWLVLAVLFVYALHVSMWLEWCRFVALLQCAQNCSQQARAHMWVI